MANETNETNATPAWMRGLDMTESRRIEKMVRMTEEEFQASLARDARTQAEMPRFRVYRGTYADAERADLHRAIRATFRALVAGE